MKPRSLYIIVFAGIILLPGANSVLALPVEVETAPTPETANDTTPTVAPTPTIPVPLVQPDTIVIQGDYRGFGLLNISPITVTYDSAPLTILLEKNQKNIVELFYPPIQAQGGQASIDVTTVDPCSVRFAPAAMDDRAEKCYTVSVKSNSTPPPPGEYHTKLYINVGEAEQKSVDVSVKVKRNAWWPFIMVAAGVLATEFLSLWSKGLKYSVNWQARRQRWLDLLSEKLDWLQKDSFIKDDAINYAVLQHVRAELRAQTKSHTEWFKQGREGVITVEQLPASSDTAKERVYPLRQTIRRYLCTPANPPSNAACKKMEDLIDKLESNFQALGQETLAEAKPHVAGAKTKTEDLYSELQGIKTGSYQALANLYKTAPPADDILKAAWKKIQAILKTGEELQSTFESALKNQLGSADNLPRIGEAINKLIQHLSIFKKAVIEVAKDEQDPVGKISDTPTPAGKQETLDVLQQIVGLAGTLEIALQEANKAAQPLKYFQDGGGVATKMKAIEDDLAQLERDIGTLRARDLRLDATVELMLRQVRQNMKTADDKMSQVQTDIDKTWRELDLLYRKDSRFIKIGSRLVQSIPENESVKRAYQLLLDGEVLAAEIELEREKEHRLIKLREDSTNPIEKLKGAISSWIPEKYDLAVLDVQERVRSLLQYSDRITLQSISMPPKEFTREESNEVVVNVVVEEKPGGIQSGYLIPGLILSLLGCIITAIFPILLSNQAIRNSISPLAWLLLILGSIVYLILVVMLIFLGIKNTIPGKFIGLLVGEKIEDLWPAAIWLGSEFGSQLLTIVVATTLVIVANNLADIADTWGSTFDFVTAFTWGVVANRIAEPVKSGWEKLVNILQPGSTTNETTETTQQGEE